MKRAAIVKMFFTSNPDKPTYTSNVPWPKLPEKISGRLKCIVMWKPTYSFWVDPIEGPLSFPHDTRHCLNGIEKLLPAKTRRKHYSKSWLQRKRINLTKNNGPLKFGKTWKPPQKSWPLSLTQTYGDPGGSKLVENRVHHEDQKEMDKYDNCITNLLFSRVLNVSFNQ